jgi:MSHA pilin protein MshA
MASGNTSPISVEGTDIAMTNGYPSAADISKTLQDFTGFTASTTGTKTTFTKDGATTAASCIVEYTEAAAGAAPTIAATTGGC